jgi:cellulose synthase/poly-beta-1,6-N-acetylglucosamine synthase-like glycosyltransferase
MIILRILEKLLIIYFGLYLVTDILLYLSAFSIFTSGKRRRDSKEKITGETCPGVSVVVPAFNEEVSVVLCTRMLLDLDYDPYQVIVVNDGSRDSTLSKMLQGFNWETMDSRNINMGMIHTAAVRNIYSAEGGRLILIDKENGGKADAINTAINFAGGEYICTIDADSILDREALHRVVHPMVHDPSIFVSGGQIALSNDLELKNNKVVSARMPRNIWIHWQILEYISTFMVARISLSRINALLIMSGAFSIFRRRDLLEVGGFLTHRNNHPYILGTLGAGNHTITEDMEIVLRLWKYYRDQKRKARAVFLPGPVCWTEAPEKPSQLYRQRMRWHQGLAETLWMYRNMMFEPRYKMTGLIAIPYYFFMELVAPLVKLFTFLLVPVLIITGLINQEWILLMLAGTILLTTIIMSTITVIIENWSVHQSATNRDALRYKNFGEWMVLLLSGIAGNFSYSFFRMFAQLNGLLNWLKKREEWFKPERKGVVEKRDDE